MKGGIIGRGVAEKNEAAVGARLSAETLLGMGRVYRCLNVKRAGTERLLSGPTGNFAMEVNGELCTRGNELSR